MIYYVRICCCYCFCFGSDILKRHLRFFLFFMLLLLQLLYVSVFVFQDKTRTKNSIFFFCHSNSQFTQTSIIDMKFMDFILFVRRTETKKIDERERKRWRRRMHARNLLDSFFADQYFLDFFLFLFLINFATYSLSVSLTRSLCLGSLVDVLCD